MSNNYLFEDLPQRIIDLDFIIEDKQKEFEGFRDTLGLDESGSTAYHIVMDAHEIGKYSFPVDIDRSGAYGTDELDEIFDTQIAYHDLFFIHRSRPIILEDYEVEVKDVFEMFKTLTHQKRHLYGEIHLNRFYTNIVDTLGKNKSGWSISTEQRSDLAIALKLAVHTYGVDRLMSIESKLCYQSDPTRCQNVEGLECLKTYKRDGAFLERVVRLVKRSIRKRNLPSLVRDIGAIDKVYFLNQRMRETGSSERFLYFSSAPRTKDVIAAFENLAPSERDYSVNPWRTPVQIYLYLILRENDGEKVYTTRTIRRLQEFRDSLQKLRLPDVLGNGAMETKSDGKRDESIAYLKMSLERKKIAYIDLFHKSEDSQLSQINLLYGFAENSPGSRRVEDNLEKYFRDPHDKGEIKSLFQNALTQTEAEILELERLRIRLRTDLDLASVFPTDMLQNDDLISNCYETFPFLVEIEDERYLKLLDALFAYWRDYYQHVQNNLKGSFDRYELLEIVRTFEALGSGHGDAGGSRPVDYYVIAALLHLVNLRKDSNIATIDYLSQLERLNTLAGNKNLLYIKASVLRRQHEFSAMGRIANEQIDDYRFKYCKALAVITEILDRPPIVTTLSEGEVAGATRAIGDLKVVLERLRSTIPDFENEARAAICADITFLATQLALVKLETDGISPFEDFDIPIAREYRDLLWKYKPKETWGNQFPGYYFVEAFYEYVTLRAFVAAGAPPTSLTDWGYRLECARMDAKNANSFNKRPEKFDLFKSLEQELLLIGRNQYFRQ